MTNVASFRLCTTLWAAALSIFLVLPARALTFQLDFAVGGFDGGLPDVSGSIQYDAAALGSQPTSLVSIDLTTLGYVWTVSELFNMPLPGNQTCVSGFEGGGGGCGVGRAINSFEMDFNITTGNISKFAIGGDGIAVRFATTFDSTLAEVAAVPLPAAFPLFASGLGMLGLLGWRRKRKARTAGA